MIAIRITTVAFDRLMFNAIGVSAATGDIRGEGSQILDLPWGGMSLIDLYVGVALICGWVVLREAKL